MNILSERYLTKLYDFPAVVLFVGEYLWITRMREYVDFEMSKKSEAVKADGIL